jgi:hypothetical protein
MTIYTHAVCTLAEAKEWMNMAADGSQDAIIINLINVVTDWLELPHVVGRRIKKRDGANADVTETFTGNGTPFHYVDSPPIAELKSITIENETAPNITLAANEVRYDPDSGRIDLIGRAFTPAWPRNCAIVYTAGWTTAPTPLWQFARVIIRRLYRRWGQQSDDVKAISTNLSGETVTYIDSLVRDDEWDLIKSYRIERYA